MTCRLTVDLGAYLLGALEPAEEERLRAHLGTCPECRDECTQLCGLPGRLGALTPNDLEGLEALEGLETTEPSPAMFDGLLRRAAEETRRRNRRRRVAGAAAAAAVLAAVVAGALTVTGGPGHAPESTTVSATNDATHVQASARLTSRSWGTQVALRLSGVAPGQRCVLVARARNGGRDTAASWVATYNGTADIRGTTAIPRDELRRLDVLTRSGRRLLTLPISPSPGHG
jgi:hypothetical protein